MLNHARPIEAYYLSWPLWPKLYRGDSTKTTYMYSPYRHERLPAELTVLMALSHGMLVMCLCQCETKLIPQNMCLLYHTEKGDYIKVNIYPAVELQAQNKLMMGCLVISC